MPLTLYLLAVLGLSEVDTVPGDAPRPNVLIVLMDDVGLDQLACYDDLNHYTDPAGYPYAYTPNIDALAAGGLRFDQARAMPVCSPTRASLLTGSYPFRHGVGISVNETSFTPSFLELGVAPAPELPILPKVLGGAGYVSAVLGKWHLGMPSSYGGTLDEHPLDLGFDEWRGTPSNLNDTFSPPTVGALPPITPGYYNYWWVENGARTQKVGKYISDRTTASAVNWIGGAPEPWFAYVAYSACHGPVTGINWPASSHGFGATAPLSAHRNTRYRACLENLDAQVGALVAAAGPRTVVFLLGDNGTNGAAFQVDPAEVRYPVGHPLHRPGDEVTGFGVAPYEHSKIKNSLYEGGIRIPLIAAGPSIVAPGRVTDELVDVVDLAVTAARLARAPLPADRRLAVDGIDLTPVLRDAPGERNWSFAEHFTPNGVGPPASRETQTRAYLRRDGADLWKLVHFVTNTVGLEEDRFEFYHLSDGNGPLDPLEETDLGESHPAFPATRRAYEELVGSR